MSKIIHFIRKKHLNLLLTLVLFLQIPNLHAQSLYKKLISVGSILCLTIAKPLQNNSSTTLLESMEPTQLIGHDDGKLMHFNQLIKLYEKWPSQATRKITSKLDIKKSRKLLTNDQHFIEEFSPNNKGSYYLLETLSSLPLEDGSYLVNQHCIHTQYPSSQFPCTTCFAENGTRLWQRVWGEIGAQYEFVQAIQRTGSNVLYFAFNPISNPFRGGAVLSSVSTDGTVLRTIITTNLNRSITGIAHKQNAVYAFGNNGTDYVWWRQDNSLNDISAKIYPATGISTKRRGFYVDPTTIFHYLLGTSEDDNQCIILKVGEATGTIHDYKKITAGSSCSALGMVRYHQDFAFLILRKPGSGTNLYFVVIIDENLSTIKWKYQITTESNDLFLLVRNNSLILSKLDRSTMQLEFIHINNESYTSTAGGVRYGYPSTTQTSMRLVAATSTLDGKIALTLEDSSQGKGSIAWLNPFAPTPFTYCDISESIISTSLSGGFIYLNPLNFTTSESEASFFDYAVFSTLSTTYGLEDERYCAPTLSPTSPTRNPTLTGETDAPTSTSTHPTTLSPTTTPTVSTGTPTGTPTKHPSEITDSPTFSPTTSPTFPKLLGIINSYIFNFPSSITSRLVHFMNLDAENQLLLLATSLQDGTDNAMGFLLNSLGLIDDDRSRLYDMTRYSQIFIHTFHPSFYGGISGFLGFTFYNESVAKYTGCYAKQDRGGTIIHAFQLPSMDIRASGGIVFNSTDDFFFAIGRNDEKEFFLLLCSRREQQNPHCEISDYRSSMQSVTDLMILEQKVCGLLEAKEDGADSNHLLYYCFDMHVNKVDYVEIRDTENLKGGFLLPYSKEKVRIGVNTRDKSGQLSTIDLLLVDTNEYRYNGTISHQKYNLRLFDGTYDNDSNLYLGGEVLDKNKLFFVRIGTNEVREMYIAWAITWPIDYTSAGMILNFNPFKQVISVAISQQDVPKKINVLKTFFYPHNGSNGLWETSVLDVELTYIFRKFELLAKSTSFFTSEAVQLADISLLSLYRDNLIEQTLVTEVNTPSKRNSNIYTWQNIVMGLSASLFVAFLSGGSCFLVYQKRKQGAQNNLKMVVEKKESITQKEVGIELEQVTSKP